MTILDMLKNPELEPITPVAAATAEDQRKTQAVELRQVTKRYGPVVAVDRVDFIVERGTLVTLLGPSGCGKTTTLRLIAGLEMVSDGRLHIDGEDVTARAAYERDVSMVFQSYALFPHMTVLQNVCYGLQTSGLKRRQIEERAAEKLSAVGLTGFEKRLPSELSGGQQQRVAVARAIVLEPKVLLFDEPLSNLDAKLRRRVREDIRALQQRLGLTVVYVTHDQEEALAVSDRIIVMKDARIVQDGAPRDLYERPADRFIADFIGSANILPATVARDMGDLALVTIAGLEMRLPMHGAATGPGEVAVRPQVIRLRAGGPEAGEIGGKVGKVAYLGSHMEYGVTLDGVPNEVFVIAGNVSAPHAVNDRVGVSIDPGGAALIPSPEKTDSQ